MNGSRTTITSSLTALAVVACVGAGAQDGPDRGSSVGSEPRNAPSEPEELEDSRSALLELNPEFDVPRPPERFHATPPKPHELTDLRVAQAAGRLPPAIFELRQMSRMRRVKWIPEMVGACEVVKRSSEGAVKSVNRTEWADGLPVASWLDDDADGVLDAEVQYTHDSENRLIRAVLKRLEYPTSCPWRVEFEERGYDAHGALVLDASRSPQGGDERRIDEVWVYDAGGRPVAIYAYDAARNYRDVELFQWSGDTLVRADSFAQDGEWQSSFLAAAKGDWLRLDYFRVIQVSANKREGAEGVGVALLEFKRSELASRMFYSRLGDGQLQPVHEVEKDVHRRVERYYTDGVLTYSETIDADGSGVAQAREKDGEFEAAWTRTWSDDRRVLTESNSDGSHTISTFDCEPFKPPKNRKRMETCPEEGQPTLGPSDADQ